MHLTTVFKEIFLKKYFDFDQPDIDIFSFHPQLKVFLVPMGILYTKKYPYLRFLWPAIFMSLATVSLVLEAMFMYHGILVEDYAFATVGFYYFILLGLTPLIYGSIYYYKNYLLALIDDMNKDFQVLCRMDSKYRRHFLNGQLLIWKLFIAWYWFMVFIAIMYMLLTIFPLLYQSLLAEQNEHTVRPLVFPLWLPNDDPYRTPNYEIFLWLGGSFCLMYIQIFSGYVYLQFHVMLHNINLLELIIMHLEVIFDGLDESVALLQRDHPLRVAAQNTLNKRIERIVTWHNSVFKSIATLSTVLGLPIMYQVMFSSIALCLMMYQVADKLDHNTFDILFVILTFATCIQLWIPCYLGTMLGNKAFEVGEACWGCGWHQTSLGRLLRLDIVIIILRSQKPLSIKFYGLPNLSLETFSSVMSTAYSYFNMLRQYSNLKQ